MMRRRLLAAMLAESSIPLLLLAACSTPPMNEQAFRSELTVQDINTSIVLVSATVDQSRQAGLLVTARLTNLSEQWVVFPPAYGAVGYSWSEDSEQWERIPNTVRTAEVPFLLGPAGGSDATSGTVVFSPGRTWPASGTLRLAVLGALRNDDGSLGDEIAAYIDVRLPE